MSTVPESNRYAPPTAHVEDVAGDTPALAGRGARLGAVLLDGVIQGVVYFALTLVGLKALMPDPEAGFSLGAVALQVVVGFVLFALINGYLLATQGQTVGKKLLGIRVVRSDGSRATVARLIGSRYVLSWVIVIIPFIGVIYALLDSLMIFRESRKCLHDHLADTIVVTA